MYMNYMYVCVYVCIYIYIYRERERERERGREIFPLGAFIIGPAHGQVLTPNQQASLSPSKEHQALASQT